MTIERYNVTRGKNHNYILTCSNGIGDWIVSIPDEFWQRFNKDQNWRYEMELAYLKLTRRNIDEGSIFSRVKPLEMDKTGVVPNGQPFAISAYWNCPKGWSKNFENEKIVEVTRRCWELEETGVGRLSLSIPAQLWSQFTDDESWRNDQINQYAKLQYFKSSTGEDLDLPEKYEGKTGVIPLP